MAHKICETNLPGTGEKPGPTTKGQFAKVFNFGGELSLEDLARKSLREKDEVSSYAGALNVEVKEGMTIGMFLPSVVVLD